MLYPDPKTRFTRKYSARFHAKHNLLKLKNDKDTIFHYTVQIANHPSPNNIGGCATCPDEIFKKLQFVTGWVILYEVKGKLIEYVDFYIPKTI